MVVYLPLKALLHNADTILVYDNGLLGTLLWDRFFFCCLMNHYYGILTSAFSLSLSLISWVFSNHHALGGRDEFCEFCLICSSIYPNRSLNTVTTALTLFGVAFQSDCAIFIPAISISPLMFLILEHELPYNPTFFVIAWDGYVKSRLVIIIN